MSRSASSRDLDLPGLEAVRLQLPLHQVAPGDLQLLAVGVAGEADDLHAVAQRPRNGVEHVRRGDEHHAGQVERHAQIVVAERVVLLGVEHFEQRGRRIAVDAAAELVDLVEHHHAVARARLADRLDDVARQRTDIGAPVAADLGFVVHAAEATRARTCGPWRARSTGRARSCPRPAGRRSTGSAPCPAGASLRTARYSTMRRLILSRP